MLTTLMEVEKVTDYIMSPGCSYLFTLTLCPSSEAAQMRELVKDKLIAGESKEQILYYFEEIYGPRVLAQPAKRGVYFFAWWFPYFLVFDAFLIAGVILFVWRRRTGKSGPGSGTDASSPGPAVQVDPDMDDILEDEVKRFREE